jgi:microcin C transport system substrate-binding protein
MIAMHSSTDCSGRAVTTTLSIISRTGVAGDVFPFRTTFSRAADTAGSRNLIGIKNPAVDALIERIVFADSREELVAATKALDRVLLWNHYVVPQWDLGAMRTARWDRFGHPAEMPKYGLSAFPALWWWDEERAAKIAKAE